MTLGERLKATRLKRKKTLDETARAIGITATSISKYESDRIKNIPRSKLEKLARYFDVSLSYLLGLEDPEDASPLILSIDEQFLVEDYRKLSTTDQKTVHVLISRLIEAENEDEQDQAVQLYL